MTTELIVPFDEQAERDLVGAAVASAAGCLSVDPSSMYSPLHRRLVEAAKELADVRPSFPLCCSGAISSRRGCLDHPDRPSTARIRAVAVATMTDTTTMQIWEIVTQRPTMGPSVSARAAVADAARRRAIMAAAAEVFNELGSGASIKKISVPLVTLTELAPEPAPDPTAAGRHLTALTAA